jgi:hypothetical protein
MYQKDVYHPVTSRNVDATRHTYGHDASHSSQNQTNGSYSARYTQYTNTNNPNSVGDMPAPIIDEVSLLNILCNLFLCVNTRR